MEKLRERGSVTRTASRLAPLAQAAAEEDMSKLWIVHRNPQARGALARLAGLASEDVLLGEPSPSAFAHEATPTSLLLGVEGDFERELEFVHHLRVRGAAAPLILLAEPDDAAEAARLFGVAEAEILEPQPTARILRARLSQAFARRESESLGARRARKRIADRFAAWLGGIEVPGLLRALDPALADLPLLVRGVPGSGRALLARYAELFRGAPIEDANRASAAGLSGRGPATLRIHARDIDGVADLARRIAHGRAQSRGRTTIWLDEVDALSVSTQNALAEWIVHQAPPGAASDAAPRWIATARPSAWRDELEAALERAFMPLVLEVPALVGRAGAMAPFAQEIARDWARSVGGPERTLSPEALGELERYPWQGDRSEVEAVLRATFAATAVDPVEASDLLFPVSPAEFAEPATPGGTDARATAAASPEPAHAVRPGTPLERLDPMPPGTGGEPLAVVEALPDESEDPTPRTASPGGGAAELDWPQTSEPAWPSPDAEADAELGAISEAERLAAAAAGLPHPARGDAPGAAVAPTETASEGEFDESTLLSEAAFGIAQDLDAPGLEARSMPEQAPPTEADAGWPKDPGWRRLARSLSHEIRNPLVSIRTFTELLPEHYGDETFRERFAELVGRDVAHINSVVTRLQNVAENEGAMPAALDVSEILESLLEDRSERFAAGRLLVLRELERDAPLAWAEENGLQVALAGLLDRALETLPERGDLFVATKYIEEASDGEPRLRILLRYHNPELATASTRPSELEELRPSANELEFVLAETVAAAHGGSLVIDSSDAQETLILMDLRTP